MADSQNRSWFTRLRPRQWLIFAVGGIGFGFDTYVLLILSLVVQPALSEMLIAKPGSPIFNMWVGRLFYIPAVCGGVFGLLGGYLIDLPWPPPSDVLEHPRIWIRYRRGRASTDCLSITFSPMRCLRGSFHRVRLHACVAGRAVYGTGRTGGRDWLFAGVRFDWWSTCQWRLFCGRHA